MTYENENKQNKEKRRKSPFIAGLMLCMAVSAATSAGVTAVAANQTTSIETADYSSSAMQLLSTGTTSSTDGSVTSIAAKASESVVEVITEIKAVNPMARQYVTEGAGSGVILSADGYIVTNFHVIDGASSITIRLTDGTEYSATLIGTDEQTDLAVLKIEAEALTPAVFADSDNIQVGDLAVAIGNPLGELGGTVTSGIISALDREITIDNQTMTLLQTSAAVNPGNSGGGLFNADGNLVGIVNAKSSGTGIEGLAFAIPSNTVTEIVSQIIENGYVTGRPQLGIQVVEVADQQTAMKYQVSQAGVYIAQADDTSGFQAGDLLASIDGTEITTVTDISAILAEHQIGDTLSVTVIRNGASTTLSVTLTEQVPDTTLSAADAA